MTVGMHMCRGNTQRVGRRGRLRADRRKAFGELNIDGFCSNSTPARRRLRAAGFVPKDKMVVLGLISSKSPSSKQGRDPATHRRGGALRPAGAARPGAAVRLRLDDRGNTLTPDDQRRKLELVVETARQVWG